MEAMGHPVPQPQLDAVHGPASGGQHRRPANAADSADQSVAMSIPPVISICWSTSLMTSPCSG